MSDRPKIVTACMIVIGNEILSGRTQDANLAWIAVRLNDLGVRLMEARVIPDVEQVIVDTINEVRRRFDYVFTSGGIGPTHDDITADCVAKAFGVGIGVHPEAKRILEAHYIQQKSEFNEARMRMARVPFGGTLIENPVSKAPGFRMENVFVMAGIPAVMRAMFESIRHELVGGAKVLSRTLSSFLPEGKFAAGLGALQVRYPDLDIGSYPFYRQGKPGASIVLRGTEAPMLGKATEELRTLIVELGGEPLETDPA